MSKLFYYDLETTGTHYWENGIHQISGIIEIDGEIKEEFDFKVQPHKSAKIEQSALDVSKITKEAILSYSPQREIYNKLIAMLEKYVDRYNKKDKFHLVGYNNASFDDNFLRAFFVQNDDKYFGSWFWAGSIDVYILTSERFMEIRNTFDDFKLNTVAKKLGIEVLEESLHDAIYDVKLTREIFYKLREKNETSNT